MIIDLNRRLRNIMEGLKLALQSEDLKESNRVIKDVLVLVMDLDNLLYVPDGRGASGGVGTNTIRDPETGECLEDILTKFETRLDTQESNLDSLTDEVGRDRRVLEAQKDRITSLERRLQYLEDKPAVFKEFPARWTR